MAENKQQRQAQARDKAASAEEVAARPQSQGQEGESPQGQPKQKQSAEERRALEAQAEERHAQMVQSAHSAVPGPGPKQRDPRAVAEAREAVNPAVAKLAELPRDVLVDLSAALDAVLSGRGQDSEYATGPSLQEVSSMLPIAEEATDKMGFDKAAKAVGVDEDSVLSLAVRQARTPTGKPIGPAYLRVVCADGSTKVSKL